MYRTLCAWHGPRAPHRGPRMSASPNPPGRSATTENELLAQLGLPPSASPEDVDQLHLAVSQYLAAAPSGIKGWAHAQAAALDEAYLHPNRPGRSPGLGPQESGETACGRTRRAGDTSGPPGPRSRGIGRRGGCRRRGGRGGGVGRRRPRGRCGARGRHGHRRPRRPVRLGHAGRAPRPRQRRQVSQGGHNTFQAGHAGDCLPRRRYARQGVIVEPSARTFIAGPCHGPGRRGPAQLRPVEVDRDRHLGAARDRGGLRRGRSVRVQPRQRRQRERGQREQRQHSRRIARQRPRSTRRRSRR